MARELLKLLPGNGPHRASNRSLAWHQRSSRAQLIGCTHFPATNWRSSSSGSRFRLG